MKFWSDSFSDGGVIPGEFAFCVIDSVTHVKLSSNRNPHFAWSDLPAGTRSLALICHDPDVPSRGDDVNQEGKAVPADLPRVDFFHWTLIDIAPQVSAIPAGTFSSGVTPRGKSGPAVQSVDFDGMRHGINDYTGWFAGDADMKGDYFGYDGPCPPWNDSIVHRYIFTLYALDVDKLAADGKFSGQQACQALKGHILAQAQWMGKYSLNPAVAKSA